MRKYLLLIIICCAVFIFLLVLLQKLHKPINNTQQLPETKKEIDADKRKLPVVEYQYDLVALNKSFRRDLDRSVNLYKSFEQHFLNAENTPFFIVIPSKDWGLFVNRFSELKNNKKIRRLPQFLTEQEVFERCGEPDVSYDGNVAQQVVKLCFGSTKIARNYIMLDSDGYFLKPFDSKTLFEGKVLKTVAWKVPESFIEVYKKMQTKCCFEPIQRVSKLTTGFENIMFMKEFFGNKQKEIYGFVTGTFLLNSDVLYRMKKFIKNKGGYKVSTLIKLVPFEMQWYGEYVLQHENFIPTNAIFTIINNPNECADLGESYGFIYQSVIYDYKANKLPKENKHLIYTLPAHCTVGK